MIWVLTGATIALGAAGLIHWVMAPASNGFEAVVGSWPHPVAPRMQSDGRPWRIGYYEGGNRIDYPHHLRALVRGLMDLGWIEPEAIPPAEHADDSKQVWDWLCERAESSCVLFEQDAYVSAGWKESAREAIRQRFIETLQGDRLDLVIAMGDWAGQDLATDEHNVPTIVCAVPHPVGAGIIKSPDDSGLSHVHAACDPNRFARELRAYHTIAGFDTLGLVYDNNVSGRRCSRVSQVLQVASSRGFRVLHCHLDQNGLTEEQCATKTAEAFEELAKDVDAIWITSDRGQNSLSMPSLLEPLLDHGVASWSQEGQAAVRRGVLLSVFDAEPLCVGHFYAHTVASVLNGIEPGAIEQRFKSPLSLAINLETARLIGFRVPRSLLKSSDIVYASIEGRTEKEGGKER